MPKSQATREDPNNFAKRGVPTGTILELVADPTKQVVTLDQTNQVRCLDDDEVMAVSAAARKYLPHAHSGYRRFRVKGETRALASRNPESETPNRSLADQFAARFHPANPLELARSLHQFNQEVGPGPGYLFDYAAEMLMPAIIGWMEGHTFPATPTHYSVYFRDDSDLRREYPAPAN